MNYEVIGVRILPNYIKSGIIYVTNDKLSFIYNNESYIVKYDNLLKIGRSDNFYVTIKGRIGRVYRINN